MQKEVMFVRPQGNRESVEQVPRGCIIWVGCMTLEYALY